MLILAGCAALISASFAVLSFFKGTQIFPRDWKISTPTVSPTVKGAPTQPVVIVETSKTPSQSPSPSPTGSPQELSSRKIVSNNILLERGQFRSYRFVIESSFRNPRVTGSVNVSGGGRNDVDFIIVDDQGLQEFTDERRYSKYYQVRVLSYMNVFVKLRPGTYYVILSNNHARFFPKRVKADLALEYD